MTRLVVILASTSKCFQLRRAEVNCGHDSYAQVSFQFMYDGRIHSRLVPAVGKTQDLLIERHDIQNGFLLAPPANRSPFTSILRKPALAESFREISICRA